MTICENNTLGNFGLQVINPNTQILPFNCECSSGIPSLWRTNKRPFCRHKKKIQSLVVRHMSTGRATRFVQPWWPLNKCVETCITHPRTSLSFSVSVATDETSMHWPLPLVRKTIWRNWCVNSGWKLTGASNDLQTLMEFGSVSGLKCHIDWLIFDWNSLEKNAQSCQVGIAARGKL